MGLIIYVNIQVYRVCTYVPWHTSQVELLFRNWIWSYFLLEELATTQLVMKIPAFKEIQIPLPCLQEGALKSCFERHEIN
jgi:hypothetical protein